MLTKAKLEKYLNYFFVATTLIAIVIPLVFIKDVLRPYIVGKMIPFQTLVLIMAIIWIGLMAIDWKRYRPRVNLITGAVTVFVFIVLISSIFGLDFYRSFWGNAERMDGFLALFHFYIFFLALYSVFREKVKIFRQFIFITLGVGFLAALWPFFQKYGLLFNPPGEGFERPPGTFGNPTFLSGYLLVCLFLGGWYLLARAKNSNEKITSWWSWDKICVIIFMAGSFISLIWTQTRGSWLGLFLGLIVFAIITLFSLPKKAKFFSGIFLTVIILVGTGFYLYKDSIKESSLARKIPIIGRLAQISSDDSSTTARLVTWRASLKWWQEAPILGVGQDNFYSVFDKNYSPNDFKVMSERFDRSHNKFIDVLVMNGVIGLVSYIFLLGSIFLVIGWQIKKTDDLMSRAGWTLIISLFVAMMVHNFFVFDTPGNSIMFFFLLAWVASLTTKGNYSHSGGKEKIKTTKNSADVINNGLIRVSIVLTISTIIGIVIFYFVDYKPYIVSHLAFSAASGNPLDLKKVNEYYQEGLARNTFINSEIRKMLADHFLNYIIYARQAQLKLDEKMLRDYADRLAEEMQRGREQDGALDFYVFPTIIYTQLSWRDGLSAEDLRHYSTQAEIAFADLKEKWPGRTDYAVIEAENNFFRGNYDLAYSLTQRIFSITPRYGRINFLQGALATAGGNLDIATDKLVEAVLNGYHVKEQRNADVLSAVVIVTGEKQYANFLSLLDEKIVRLMDNPETVKNDRMYLAEMGIEFGIKMRSQNIGRMAYYLENFLAMNPNRAEYWARLAAIYGHWHNKEKAIYSAQKATEFNPSFATETKLFIQLIETEQWDKLP